MFLGPCCKAPGIWSSCVVPDPSQCRYLRAISIGASCQVPQWKVLCAVGSSASPSAKCVENWGCCRINGSIFPQCGFLLQPVAGTTASTPWRVLLFPSINPRAPHLPKSITQSCQEGMNFQIRGLAPAPGTAHAACL